MKTTMYAIAFLGLLLNGSSYADLNKKAMMKGLRDKAADWEKTFAAKDGNSCKAPIKVELDEKTMNLIPPGTSETVMLTMVECFHSSGCWNEDIRNAVANEKQITKIKTGVTDKKDAVLKLEGKTLVAYSSPERGSNIMCDQLKEFLMKNLK